MPKVSLDAEQMIKRRAMGAIVLASLLIVTQGSRMGPAGESMTSWGIWTVALLVFILWASGILRGRAMRVLVNDESSEENRRRALICGFWISMASAAVCFGLTFLKDYGARDAIQVIMTTGIAGALLHFGSSERRGLRV